MDVRPDYREIRSELLIGQGIYESVVSEIDIISFGIRQRYEDLGHGRDVGCQDEPYTFAFGDAFLLGLIVSWERIHSLTV